MEKDLPENLVGKQRMEALTEGIYAIALTLLVLELKLPALPDGASNAQLLDALRELLPKALTWLLSFWVMMLFWLGQVRTYRLCAGLDSTMVRIELVHLAGISLLPFSTALQGEHGDLTAASAVYAANLFAVSLLSSLRSWHVMRTPALQIAGFPTQTAQRVVVRMWATLACIGLAFVLSFFYPGRCMLVLVPIAFLSARKA